MFIFSPSWKYPIRECEGNLAHFSIPSALLHTIKSCLFFLAKLHSRTISSVQFLSFFFFGVKDPVPDGLHSHVGYKFVRAGCNACYVGEMCRHFSTHVREHLISDRASHIFKHLQDSAHCCTLCSADSFHVLDHAFTGFQLKIKEAIRIQREQWSLNQQLHHVNLKLSF